MTDDIAFLPATRLLELYRAKELSPVAVMKETLARLERYEGALNAFVLYDPDSAMAAARESEARWRRGEPHGLLDGIPVALKDTVLTTGWPRLVGSRTIDPNQEWTRGFARRGAIARCRRAVLRQDHYAGIRLEGGDGLAALRHYPQPLGPRAHPRRQQRRQRRRGAGRHLSAGGRHRRRRLDPHPGRVLRDFRAEADLRPGRGLSALGLWRRRACRADDANRRRRRADARRDQGAGFARLVQPAR